MPTQYKYRAVDWAGRQKSGTVGAIAVQQVEEFLREHSLIPVKISEIKPQSQLSFFGFQRRVDYEKLIMFTNSLSTMYRSGIPLLHALSIIRVGKPDDPFNLTIERIRHQVQSGRSLSSAMRDHEDTFTGVYTASVEAGEESGKLDEILDELAGMLESEHELTRQVKSAIRYPLTVVIIIVLAIFVLMSFVIPRFVAFYSSFDAELPLPTKIIIGMSSFVSTYWPVILVVLGGAAYVFKRVVNTPGGRMWHDRKLLKFPVLGDLVTKANVARFCMMFRILFKSGIPLVRSLSILAGTVRNVAMAEEFQLLEDTVRHGKGIDTQTGDFEFMPDQALRMMGVGLESGSLERMLGEIGEHYRRQVIYTSRHLTSIIEPILTLVLGSFVLLLALAIFLPMWNLIEIFRQ
ncbi:MAG: type II secretion system F family protein [Candidatus Zixiibacteriota bacterium]|nr:MAG: type II secretion system F family protein [candidate division Zixibacteria bacterium]